jgi:hypothetical protein
MLVLSHLPESTQMQFFVTLGCLLGFIILNKEIIVDPLKVEEIVKFPPLRTIRQLHSLQVKENFLHHFITNYTDIIEGFMHFLNKWVPFE